MTGNPSLGRRLRFCGLQALAATALLGALGLLGCPGSEPPPTVTPIELPAPLIGGAPRASLEPALTVDPTDWKLPDPVDAPWVTLFVSQDNRGELQACGCPGSPSGGMARRATWVDTLRDQLPASILLEGPNSLSRSVAGLDTVTPEQRARGRMVLKLLAERRPDAFFPGHADFAAVPPAELAELAQSHGLPLVATNLDPSVAGYRRSLEVEVRGRRVLLLGLLGTPANEAGRRRASLVEATGTAGEVIEAASRNGRPDVVVVLTDGDQRDVGNWLADGLEVDIVITSPRSQGEAAFRWVGETLVVRSEPLGRSFRRIDLLLGGPAGLGLRGPGRHQWIAERVAAAESQYLRMLRRLRALEAGDAEPADAKPAVGEPGAARSPAASRDVPTQIAELRASLAELKARRRSLLGKAAEPNLRTEAWVSEEVIHSELPEDPGTAAAVEQYAQRWLARITADVVSDAPVEERYASKDSCVDCHPSQLADWSRTRHAAAWAPLQARGSTRDPECLACHSTGFGDSGGFVDPDEDRTLLGVQCEACHGAMEAHVQAARKSPRFRPPASAAVTEATCRRCHDPANSPKFDYATYLPKVRHKR